MPTIHRTITEFFYEYADGHRVPTVRPHGWYSEKSEKRVIAALKRKGWKFEGSPQLWKGYIGASAWVTPIAGPFRNEDWQSICGESIAEMLAGIKRLPDRNASEAGA